MSHLWSEPLQTTTKEFVTVNVASMFLKSVLTSLADKVCDFVDVGFTIVIFNLKINVRIGIGILTNSSMLICTLIIFSSFKNMNIVINMVDYNMMA